jgi:uncharacterized RDD family membrane protein YckC
MSTPTPPVNPYAMPNAAVADIAPTHLPPELASLGQRLGGAIVDTILILIVVLPVIFMVLPQTMFAENEALAGAVSGLFGIAFFLAANGYLLAKHGQTIGKRVAGTRIVRSDYSRATFGRILGLRLLPFWLLGLVPYIGNVSHLVNALFIFRASRRCLHDDLADTIVVKAEGS